MRSSKDTKKNRVHINLEKKWNLKKRWIKGISHLIADLLELERVEVSVYITDDETIKELNGAYRGKYRSTDVLSFPFGEKLNDTYLLGEIVISVETAERQAKDMGHSLEEEIKRLLVHGFIHLLGYDHEKGKEEREFREMEERILSGLSSVGY